MILTEPRAGQATLSPFELRVAIAATTVLGLLVFIPMPRPIRPFWSLFFFGEYPWLVRLLLVLAPLALTLSLQRWLGVAVPRLADAMQAARRATPWLMWIASFALFWIFREQRHWGDAGYTVDILEGVGDVGPLGRYFWKEPLDRLAAVAFTALGRHIGLDAESSVALLSSLAGSVCVVVLWSLSARLGRTGPARLVSFALPLSAGASQLFFGHVENYTLVTLAMLLFFREGLAVTAGEGSFVRAGLLAALAVTTHPLAVFLIAPLVALPFLRPQPVTPRDIARFAAAMLPGILYFLVFYALCRILGAPPLEVGVNSFGGAGRVFMDPARVFGAKHLWDVMQNYLLTLPAGAVVVLLQRFREKPAEGRDRTALLLAIAALSFLILALFLHGTLRRRRDWDLFAPASLPVSLLAARLLARWLDGRRASLGLGVFLVLFSLAVCGPWIASNYRYVEPARRSDSASVERIFAASRPDVFVSAAKGPTTDTLWPADAGDPSRQEPTGVRRGAVDPYNLLFPTACRVAEAGSGLRPPGGLLGRPDTVALSDHRGPRGRWHG